MRYATKPDIEPSGFLYLPNHIINLLFSYFNSPDLNESLRPLDTEKCSKMLIHKFIALAMAEHGERVCGREFSANHKRMKKKKKNKNEKAKNWNSCVCEFHKRRKCIATNVHRNLAVTKRNIFSAVRRIGRHSFICQIKCVHETVKPLITRHLVNNWELKKCIYIQWTITLMCTALGAVSRKQNLD